MKCGLCHQQGHGSRTCPKNPWTTTHLPIPQASAELLWQERLVGIWKAASLSEEPIKIAMLSAYLQGAMDGQTPAVLAAMTELVKEERQAHERCE